MTVVVVSSARRHTECSGVRVERVETAERASARHIEESAGTITLATAADKIHLNSVFQEAEAAVKRQYPGAVIFRAHPGKGGNDTTPGGATVQWNGKPNASYKNL